MYAHLDAMRALQLTVSFSESDSEARQLLAHDRGQERVSRCARAGGARGRGGPGAARTSAVGAAKWQQGGGHSAHKLLRAPASPTAVPPLNRAACLPLPVLDVC
jgi:hypothetical protein